MNPQDQIENPKELDRRAEIAHQRMKMAWIIAIILSVVSFVALVGTKYYEYAFLFGR